MRTPPERLAEVLDDLERAVEIRTKTARELEEWYTAKKKAISTDRADLRVLRLNCIRAKLVKMGWKAEIEYLADNNHEMRREFEKLPQVYRPQELTTEGWTTIEATMVDFMEKAKEARLEAACIEVLKGRLKDMKCLVEDVVSRFPGLTLSMREIAACIPEVAQVLDPSILQFDIDALRQSLPVWISRYLEKRDQSTQDSLSRTIKDMCNLDPLCGPFSLAIGTIFVCVECRTGRPLHLAIRHHCGMPYGYSPLRTLEARTEYQRTVESFCDSSYDSETFWHESVYAPGLARMMKIIRICGLDVKTATIEDLDRAGVVLQATPNPAWNQHDETLSWSMPVMTWRTAVVGTKEYLPEKYKISAATEEQIAATKDLFPASQTRFWDSWNAESQFCCGLCSTTELTSRQSVLAHLQQEHGLFEPTEDECLDGHLTVPVADPVYLVAKHYRKNTLWQHSRFVRNNLFEKGVAAFFNLAETVEI